jgi:hypothetical protein
MEELIIAVVMAIFIGAAQFSSEAIVRIFGRHYSRATSLSAGISITYLFLDLIPHFSGRAVDISRFLFLSLLAGFLVIHLVEKYIYRHSPAEEAGKQIGYENQIISFCYHFILGIIIVDFAGENLRDAILLFIPVFIFTSVNTLPVTSHPDRKINAAVSLSTLLGVLFAGLIYGPVGETVHNALLGFVIGAILFSAVRHSIPPGAEGEPLYFFLGVAGYAPIIITGWLL